MYKAKNKVTKDIVALKKIRVHSENFGVRFVSFVCEVQQLDYLKEGMLQMQTTLPVPLEAASQL